MKRVIAMGILFTLFMTITSACGNTGETKQDQEAQDMLSDSDKTEYAKGDMDNTELSGSYTVDTTIAEVAGNPVFEDYGRLIFPVDTGYYSGNTLGELRLTWYNNIDPDKTVEIANYMYAGLECCDRSGGDECAVQTYPYDQTSLKQGAGLHRFTFHNILAGWIYAKRQCRKRIGNQVHQKNLHCQNWSVPIEKRCNKQG